MWEIIVVGTIILGVVAMAIWREGVSPAMKVAKPKKVTVIREINGQTIDVTEVATAVAKAVAETMSKELLDKLDNLQIKTAVDKAIRCDKDGPIELDESIIPVAMEALVDHINMDNVGEEEELEDKDLASSKSKLAKLLKGK